MNYFKVAKFFLYLIPFTVIIISTPTLFPFIVGKYVWFRTSIDLSFFFLLLGFLLHRDANEYLDRLKKWAKSPVGIAIGIFTVVFVLASLFAFDAVMGFWSNFERGEGGFQILHFYLFFILLGTLFKDGKDWRNFFWLSIIAGFLMIFYGIGASLKYVDAEIQTNPGVGSQPVWTGKGGFLFQVFKTFIGSSFKEPNFRFEGSIGNPAYVATYLIFMIFYGIYLVLTSKKRILSFKNILLLALIALFAVFFVFAGTRGAFIGLSVSAFLSILFLAYAVKKWRVKLISLVVLIVLCIVLISTLKHTPLLSKIPVLRIFDISISARTFQDRIFIWKSAWEGFKARPILGWGPENFSQVFDRHFQKDMFSPEKGFGAWFDRAHSIFFDYLVETGILGLLSYISIFLLFYFELFKVIKQNRNILENENKKSEVSNTPPKREYVMKAILFAMPIAYLVQGLVLFEVLVIYLNLFVFLAFANYKFQNQ